MATLRSIKKNRSNAYERFHYKVVERLSNAGGGVGAAKHCCVCHYSCLCIQTIRAFLGRGIQKGSLGVDMTTFNANAL